MNTRLNQLKEKITKILDKLLKNKKDINLNSSRREKDEYKKMHDDMKMY